MGSARLFLFHNTARTHFFICPSVMRWATWASPPPEYIIFSLQEFCIVVFVVFDWFKAEGSRSYYSLDALVHSLVASVAF